MDIGFFYDFFNDAGGIRGDLIPHFIWQLYGFCLTVRLGESRLKLFECISARPGRIAPIDFFPAHYRLPDLSKQFERFPCLVALFVFHSFFLRYIFCGSGKTCRILGSFLCLIYSPLVAMLYRDWCCPFLRYTLTRKKESKVTRNTATVSPMYRARSDWVSARFAGKKTFVQL